MDNSSLMRLNVAHPRTRRTRREQYRGHCRQRQPPRLRSSGRSRAIVHDRVTAPVFGLALALLVGVTLGLVGGGGSILTVPIFVYVLGYDPKPAIAMSLAVVAVTSFVGVLGHWRAGRVDLRVAAVFGVIAMVGALVGTRLATFVSGGAQLALFGTVMMIAAIFMFRRGAPAGAITEVVAIGWLALAPVAFGVGVLTGLVGVGGGFMIVPALVLLGRLPMKQAVGTSLLVIAMNAFAAFLGYLGVVSVNWGVMASFTAFAIVGILAGTWVVRFVPQEALKRGFAVLLVLMGSLILYQNRDVLRAGAARLSERSLHAAATLL